MQPYRINVRTLRLILMTLLLFLTQAAYKDGQSCVVSFKTKTQDASDHSGRFLRPQNGQHNGCPHHDPVHFCIPSAAAFPWPSFRKVRVIFLKLQPSTIVICRGSDWITLRRMKVLNIAEFLLVMWPSTSCSLACKNHLTTASKPFAIFQKCF